MSRRMERWLLALAALALPPACGHSEATEVTRFIVVHSVSGNIEPCGCGENVSGGWANLVGQTRPLGLPLVSGGNFIEGGTLDRITAEALRDHLGFEGFLVCLGPDELADRTLLPNLGRPYVCASVRDETADVTHVGTVGNTRITSVVEPALAADPRLVDPLVALERLALAMDDRGVAGVVFLYAKEATRDRILRWVKKSDRPILIVDCQPLIQMPVCSALGRGLLVQFAPAARQFVRLEVGRAPEGAKGSMTPDASIFHVSIETTGSSHSETSQDILRQHNSRLEGLVDDKRGVEGVVGSEACRGCHATEYEHWSATGHARAVESLTKVGKATQVRCYSCHITSAPLERATSWLPSLPVDPDLRCVGCESCHGPGGKHSRTESAADIARPTARTCVPCHTRKLRLTFSYEIDIQRATCQPRRPG